MSSGSVDWLGIPSRTFSRRNCGADMDSRVGAVGASGAVRFSRKAEPDYIDSMSRVTSHDVDAWLAEIEAKLVGPLRERLGLDH